MKEKIGSLSNEDIREIHEDYNKHISDGEVRENTGILVVLDVLGWKNNVHPQDITVYFSLINQLRSSLLDTCLRCAPKDIKPNVRIATLSDTIAVLIDKDYHVKKASDGSGSVYYSLKKNGCLEDMEKRKIKWIFIGGVDNILLKQTDPVLLGLAIYKNSKVASKTILKSYPDEKVGLFCSYDKHPRVIEYSEMPREIAYELTNNNKLKYKEAHIMCNLYTLNALNFLSAQKLPYHIALKKNSYLDESGKEIIPSKPNSYKLESFIFDGFPYFDDIALLRGEREEDFAPIKNKEGNDSPATARVLYKNYHTKR